MRTLSRVADEIALRRFITAAAARTAENAAGAIVFTAAPDAGAA